MESLYKQVYEKYSTTFYSSSVQLPNQEELKNANLGSKLYEIKTADSKYPYFKFESHSEKKEDFISNYGNQLAAVSVNRVTYVVDKFEDKISIKLYVFEKNRRVGKVYSQKLSIVYFITYKYSTKELYFGHINKKNNKITGRNIRKNYFGGLTPPFKTLMSRFTQYILTYSKPTEEIVAADIFHDSFSIFIKNIPGFRLNKLFNHSNMEEYFYENYLINKNIKYSNNYLSFIDKVPMPNKRILKKCDNKFIEAFMRVNNMRGDKIKKILHTSEVINEHFYKNVIKMFGEDFVKEQSYEDLKSIFNYSSGYAVHNIVLQMSKNEKKRAFSTLIDIVRNNNSYNTFIDHINFYIELNKYEKVKWTSVDTITFNREHGEWSEKISFFKKGAYTREYNPEFIEEIEKPILDNYYPIVFTKSKEYIDESANQNNCVKTYVDRAASLIISVRNGGRDSAERATIEYQITKDKKSDNLNLRRVQSLGKFNQMLSIEWGSVLNVLDERINELVKQNKFTLPKVTIENKMMKIKSNSIFINNFLIWESPEIKNLFYQHEVLF